MEMLAYLCVSNFRTAVKSLDYVFSEASKTLLESLFFFQDYTTCLFLKCNNWMKVKVLIINSTNTNILQI